MWTGRELRKRSRWAPLVLLSLLVVGAYLGINHFLEKAREAERRQALRAFITALETDKLRLEPGEGLIQSDVPEGTPDEATEFTWGKRRPDGSTAGFRCTTKKIDLEQQSEEFVTLNPTEEWLYPGALLQGATIQGGTPAWINAGRSEGVVQLAVQTGAQTDYSEAVSVVSRSTVGQALNNILARYQGKTPGQLVISQERIYSQGL